MRDRLRENVVSLRLTVLRTGAILPALKRDSLAVEYQAQLIIIKKFWKGEREGENLF